MDLLWMILPVFVVCVEAEKLTDVKVELGQNVTLNCSLDTTAIYWFIEIHSQVKGCIARTFSKGSGIMYYVSTSVTKYVAINGTSLLITNITAEDCRLYFCGRRLNDSITFEDTFRIVSDVPVTPSPNISEADHHHHHHQEQHISEVVMFSSFALNILLLLAVIGLILMSLCSKKKNHNYQLNEPSSFTCESPETQETAQYDEIQLPPYREPPPAAPPPDCIYYKAQLPQSTLPQC